MKGRVLAVSGLFFFSFLGLLWPFTSVDIKPIKEITSDESWIVDKREKQCLDYASNQVLLLKKALNYMSVNQRTSHCQSYQESLRKIIYPEEDSIEFPEHANNTETKLAFSFIVHNQVGLFEVLLHLTFRPYNAYCIYVGNNSLPEIIESISNLVQCYQTMFPESKIFMASHAKPVKWGQYSLLEADLTCMEQLLDLKDQ